MILRTDSALRLHHAATRAFQEGEVHVTRVYSYGVLILMLEGELRFLEDGREVTLQAGEYYIQRAGLLQEGLPLGASPPTYFYVEFSGGEYEETGEGLALRGSFSERAIHPLIEAYHASYTLHTANRFRLNSYMYRIFSELSEASPAYNNTTEVLSMVRRYLNAEYASPVTLKDLSRRFGYQQDYLARRFRERYGVTLYRYLTSVRMEQALWLLRNTDLHVTEVATAVGYHDHSVFYRAFEKHYGSSPSDFR